MYYTEIGIHVQGTAHNHSETNVLKDGHPQTAMHIPETVLDAQHSISVHVTQLSIMVRVPYTAVPCHHHRETHSFFM